MPIINDGHATLISFANAPSIALEEKTVTPPGVDGGGENDTTTMRNSVWRTKQPKSLKTLTPCSATVAYDPAVFDTVVAQTNVNQQITITFADSSTLVFFGWLNTFTPSEVTEGAQPEADIEIIPSNQNLAGVETAPVYSA